MSLTNLFQQSTPCRKFSSLGQLLILLHLISTAGLTLAADVLWNLKDAPFDLAEDNAQSVTANAIHDARRYFADTDHSADTLTLLYPAGTYNFIAPNRTDWRLSISTRGVASSFTIGDVVAIKSKHGKDLYRFVDCDHITLDGIKYW